jgi:hypothetical protein
MRNTVEGHSVAFPVRNSTWLSTSPLRYWRSRYTAKEVATFLGRTIADYRRLLTALQEAKSDRDQARIRAVAHAFKGLFLNIGDRTGATICELVTIEDAYRTSGTGVLRRYVNKTLIVLEQQPEMRDQ